MFKKTRPLDQEFFASKFQTVLVLDWDDTSHGTGRWQVSARTGHWPGRDEGFEEFKPDFCHIFVCCWFHDNQDLLEDLLEEF